MKSPDELAAHIQRETGQVVRRAGVIGKRYRLNEERMRAELTEDLAKKATTS